MVKLIYSRSDQMIIFEHGDGTATPFECRNAHFSGNNDDGQPYESLPLGSYTAHAYEPPAEDSDEYGTFYIATGDPRGRDIHGGGSGLGDPKVARQGWYPTLGCLRMQNEDGEALSMLIIAAGNDIPLEVLA